MISHTTMTSFNRQSEAQAGQALPLFVHGQLRPKGLTISPEVIQLGCG